MTVFRTLTVDNMTNGRVCVCVAADSNPEVAMHALCVSAAMRAIADTSMRHYIFLFISIAQLVLALNVFKSLYG